MDALGAPEYPTDETLKYPVNTVALRFCRLSLPLGAPFYCAP
jgi:hypothetical protein